jgi:hypothetical protein
MPELTRRRCVAILRLILASDVLDMVHTQQPPLEKGSTSMTIPRTFGARADQSARGRVAPAVVLAGTVLLILIAAGLRGVAQQSAAGEWRSDGGDKGFTRYSPLDRINRDNVASLRPVWRRPSIDPQLLEKYPDLVASNYFRGTPIMIDGALYAALPDGAPRSLGLRFGHPARSW